MRILYIIPSFQHPTVRGPHRHYHFIRALSRSHEITLLTPIRSKVPMEAHEEMTHYTERILTFDLNGGADSKIGRGVRYLPVVGGRLQRLLKNRDGLLRMRRAFLELATQGSYDLVLFHGKSVFDVIAGWQGLPLVVDFCDASSMRMRSRMQIAGWSKFPKLLFRFLQMRQIEKRVIAKTPHVAFISNRDKNAVVPSTSNYEIIPIGVDHDYWRRSKKAVRSHAVIFTGVMDYGPNHDAAMYLIQKILPLVRASVPDIKVVIAGRDPQPELTVLSNQNPEVAVTGFVDDMRPYLEAAAVFAAPLRFASGIQNKVLEAMAMELPVVTTKVVADGLYLESYGQTPLIEADSEREFAKSIIRLLKDKAERARLALEGRDFVTGNFNWERSAEKLENLCLKAAKRKGKEVQSIAA